MKIYESLSCLRKDASFIYGSLDFLIIDDDIFSFIRKADKHSFYLVGLFLHIPHSLQWGINLNEEFHLKYYF